MTSIEWILMLTLLSVNMMRHFHLYWINMRIYVVERPMINWMAYDILVLKALRRKHESIWRNTRLTVHFDMYSESCMAVKRQLVRVNLG